MNKPSTQQLKIVEFVATHNVIVDAVAGSGKTTTVLHIAKHYPDKKILLLVYNRSARLETADKINKFKLKNILSSNYHHFAYHFYKANDEREIKSNIITILEEDTQPQKIINFDIVIVDEFQDANEIFYRFVLKILRNNQVRNPTMVLLGDKFQNINSYLHCDERYLTCGDKLFSHVNNRPWKRCNLSISYRLTDENAKFINKLIGYNRIQTLKSGSKPTYIFGKQDDVVERIIKEIQNLISEGYNCDDIFILNNSVNFKKQKSNKDIAMNILRKLCNHRDKIPIYSSDNENGNTVDYLSKKTTIATFNATKGLERKVVFVLNFDEGYYKKIYKEDTGVLTNTQYVALTRAIDKLYVVHTTKNRMLNCCTFDFVEKYCNISQSEFEYMKSKISTLKPFVPYQTPTPVNVTDLVKHVPEKLVNEIISSLDYKLVKYGGIDLVVDSAITFIHESIDGKLISESNNNENLIELNEYVGHIYGDMIPMYYIYKYHKKKFANIVKNTHIPEKIGLKIIKRIYGKRTTLKKYNSYNIDYNKFLCTAIFSIFNDNKKYHLFHQINNTEWINEKLLNSCADRIHEFVKFKVKDKMNELRIESSCRKSINVDNKIYDICGRCDMITENILYELKATKQIEGSHILQTMIYRWMVNNNKLPIVYNPIINTSVFLPNNQDFSEIIKNLIRAKYNHLPILSDEEFVKHNLKFIQT